MNTGQRYIDHLSMIVKRALEGKMGPFNFLIILGFFSSLVLLYISLHVHMDGISKKIDEGRKKGLVLNSEELDLIKRKNELASAERIIPLAKAAGMQPGAPDQILRIAYSEPDEMTDDERARWALRGGAGSLPTTQAGVPESR